MRKNITPYLLLSACIVMLSGCIVINTTGLYTGYSKLSEESKKKVVITDENYDCDDFIFDDERVIYAINGQQLMSCLKDTEKAIVYTWAEHCNSQVCILLSYYQEKAEQCGYQPFVVTEYLSEDVFPQVASPDLKTFWPNEFYYDSKYCNKNLNRLLSELTGKDKKELGYYRFYLFENGKFIRSINSIEELQDCAQ